jgi:hypothetical protein
MTVEKVEENKEQVSKAEFEELLNVVKGLQEENKVLKAHADETIQEKRALKAKHDEEKATFSKELEDKVNRSKDENDQLMKQYKEQNAKLQQDIEVMKQKEYTGTLNSKAKELAIALAKTDAVKTDDLAEKFARRLKLDADGSLKVLDVNGDVTISPVDQLVSEISTKYAYLCDGVQSTGGGSHSSASGAQAKKFNELSEEERVTLYRTDANEYRKLKSEQ